MMCVCAIPTAGNAFTLTIAGNANFMDSKTAQSTGSWNTNFVTQSISENTGDFYFWATGNFKLSQADPAPTDWETFNTDKVFQITESTINWNVHDVSNLGTGCKFIHLHIGTGGSNYVKVQDEPFAGHEGVWSTTPFEEGETIYYFPNENFKSSDAIFRAVFNDRTTVLCHNYEFDPDYYTFTVPKEGLTAVKIERGKADKSDWWGNFTVELKSKDKGSNNCITMKSDNGDNWESAPSSWTYYEPLTEPATYTYYFCSRSTESEEWQLQTLVPEYGKCSFTRSDLSGKQFAIKMDVNGVQRYWLIPATAIDFTTTKSYSLTYDITNSCTFPSEAPESDYTFVIEFNGKKPSRLRVNPTAAAYNQTLFVGIASSNRHQIQYNEDTKTYEDYKFYVNQEDLDNDGEFGFRFYSEPNGGVWMGNNEFGKVFGTDPDSDFKFDTEITTSGIKRYFLKETGAYAINVKSYVPETNKVEFSLSKLEDGAIVAPELYIKTGDKDRTRIESSQGKYKPFKIENVSAGTKFCFYSAATDGNRMGPVYTADLNVDTEGTLPYTTIGADRDFKLAEAGTYIINVSEYLANEGKVTFTVTKEPGSSVHVPNTLYLRNSRNGDGALIPMTCQEGAGDNDRNPRKFFAEVDYNANEDFAFHFIENNESSWSDRGIVYYPGETGNTPISANTPVKINNVSSCDNDPGSAWLYNSTESGKITVMVYFKKNGTATVEVVGNSDKNYYFIGDMNNWFSNEFDGDLGGTDKNGETIARGINATRWEADKDNWKLEYVGDGWYRFDSFPGNLLSGHFQIVSNGSWELKDGNEIYSHVIYINPEDVKANKMSDYRAFKMDRITREDITKGREYRVRKRSADVSGGSNLGTQCNAVEGAVFWFNPGNDTEAPRIRITGTPKDYFIFYNMEDAKVNPDMKKSPKNGTETIEYWVRAAINSGKPNTNNYFLAGIEYGDYTLPFYDINGNTGAHMNVNEGIDLAPYDLKSMTERELNNLFFSNKDIVNSILNEGRLPNGRDIKVYDKVWIAKVPSGFENPAGTKYNMTFNKAMTDADRKATRTLTTRHYYFFPQQAGLHVHVNIDEILAGDKVESAEVAYRLYKTDNQYNTIAILHGSDVTAEGHRDTEILHKVGSALPRTKDSEATNKIGWYECNKPWNAPDIEGNWLVNWIGDEATGARREVAYDDNSAFVQFRLTITMKEEQQPASRSAEGDGKTMVFYLPERVDVANDDNHYWFENSDLYAKLKASDLPDGVLTGISEIVDDTDNGPAVYYNLQGVRVDNPAAGNIYIKVTRKGSEKILF